MILNPIIQRELISTLRTRKAMLLQIAVVTVLSLLVVLRWPTDAVVAAAGAGSGQQSLEVLRVFGYGLMVAIMLLAPAFPAASIVRERQQGTLALLLNSPMPAWSIFLGKLGAAMGFVCIIMVLTIPLAAACYAMGGIGLRSLIWLYIVLGMLALQYCTLALLISSRAGTVDSALRLTFGGVLLLGIFTLGPYQLMGGLAGAGQAEILDWIRSISPISAVAACLQQTDVAARGMVTRVDFAGRFVLISLLLSGIFSAMTIARLNPLIFDRPRPKGTITDERDASVRAMRRLMYLWFFDPRRRSSLIGPLTNAVMVKEFRCRRFGRSGWLVRLVAACLVFSLLLMLLSAYQTASSVAGEYAGVERLGAVIVLLQVALVVLITPSLASGLISTERESRGWQLLQMTPLSSVSIVTGKLMSVGVVLLLILLATLPSYGVLMVADLSQVLRVKDVLITLVLTSIFALILSAAVSSLFARTAVSTAISYTLLVGLCAGTMLMWLGEDRPFSQSAVEAVIRFNPLAAALDVIDAPMFSKYTLVPFNWYFLMIASAVCLVILVFQTWRLTRPQ